MRKFIASTTVAASLIGGGTAAIVLAPAIAGAQESETVERGAAMAEALDSLVTDGTLTQEQRDTVEERLREARAERRGEFRRGPRGRFGAGQVLEELGIDREAVRDGVDAGLTLGEIADANGSSADALTDALIAAANERIDAAVENGRIDEARADELRASVDDRVSDLVDGELEFRGRRGGR